MVKISTIIMPMYNKLLPECEVKKISLNLDLPDPTIPVKDAKQLEKTLNRLTKSAMKRAGRNGSITIAAESTADGSIIITTKDTGEVLTREERAKIADENTEVRSRMGYGTTVTTKIPA